MFVLTLLTIMGFCEIMFTFLLAFSHVVSLLFCQLQAVWFGCDVGQHFERKRGALHLDM